ncbi:type 4a pilus biogenesis protein PilO [Patescibacteria group bacterium]|nr:type 4a pilus biogenesis protein PilO [Patescibacteria group bacterium]
MSRNLFIGILLFVGIVLGIFLTWPKYQDFQQLSFELKVRSQKLENKEAFFVDLKKAKRDIAQLQEPFLKIEAALPLNSQLPQLYDFLQTSAAFSGMSVRNISALVERQEQALLMRTIPVVFELTGSFNAIKELISRLNFASRVVTLQSLNISSGQESGRFNVIIQLHAYSY